jgi:hypothetical protein
MKCDDEVDFCPTCCEKEFGEMFMDLRKKCFLSLCSENAIRTANDKAEVLANTSESY